LNNDTLMASKQNGSDLKTSSVDQMAATSVDPKKLKQGKGNTTKDIGAEDCNYVDTSDDSSASDISDKADGNKMSKLKNRRCGFLDDVDFESSASELSADSSLDEEYSSDRGIKKLSKEMDNELRAAIACSLVGKDRNLNMRPNSNAVPTSDNFSSSDSTVAKNTYLSSTKLSSKEKTPVVEH